jgi:predicted DNA-binding transcriptional regulator AlpA
MTADDELLTVADVAAITHYSPHSLHTRRHRGLPPQSFKLGSKVVYRRKVVQEWIDRSEVDTRRGQS